MAITGTFTADFANFLTAVDAADVKLKGFEADSGKVETALGRLTNSLGGTKLIQDALVMTKAVETIGGTSKLTEAQLQRVGAQATEAAATMTAMGRDVPPGLQRIADEARGAAEATLRFADANKQAEGPTSALSVALGTMAGQLLLRVGEGLASWGKEALLTSARVETLGSVAHFMGAQAGFTTGEIDALVASLRAQGITSGQSYDTVIQLTRANMSLADATKLATVAQSLARATGQNSSETVGQLIRGIQTLQVETLRNAGVVIQLDQEYIKFAATHGRVVTSLGAEEKQQIALAAVLREGEKVAGVYGVTNENVGGKIQSLARYQEEASKSIGDVFLPALRLGVDGLTGFYKLVQQAPETFAVLGVGLSGAALALTGFKTASALGAISAGTLSTAIGLIAPALAVVATAFTAWKIGTWIGEVSGLTDGVERLAGWMMGLSSADIEAGMAARTYAESADGHAAATKHQAAELATLSEKARAAAIEVAAKAVADAKALETAKLAMEAEKKRGEAMIELNAVGVGWRGTLDTISGAVVEGIKFYLEAGVSQAALAAAYGLTAVQIKAVASARAEEIETIKVWDGIHKTTFALAMAHEKQWREERTQSLALSNAAVLAEFDAQVKLNAASGRDASGAIQLQTTALDVLTTKLAALHLLKVEGISQEKQEALLMKDYTDTLLKEAQAQDAVATATTKTQAAVASADSTVGQFKNTVYLVAQDLAALNLQLSKFYDDLDVNSGVGNMGSGPSNLGTPVGNSAGKPRIRGAGIVALQNAALDAFGMNAAARWPLQSFSEGGSGDFGFGTPVLLHGKETITKTGEGGGGVVVQNTFHVNGTAEESARQILAILTTSITQGRKLSA